MTSQAVLVRRTVTGWNRPLMSLVAVTAVLGVAAATGLAVDDRVLTGFPIWLKPFKFAVSTVLYGTALAWMLAQLPRPSKLAERTVIVIVAALALEIAVIGLQVMRGQTSHYNQTSSFNSFLWNGLMGPAIMILFVGQIVLGYAILKQRLPDRTVNWAVGLGLGVSLVGMLAAVPMVLPTAEPGLPGISGAHSVGVLDGGPGLPITGWSTVGGDLRAGHFLGLHALQALPLLGFLLLRLGARFDEATRIRLLIIAGAAYTGLTVLLTWQALRGQSVIRPDALTLGALAVLVSATAVAAAIVLCRRTGVVR